MKTFRFRAEVRGFVKSLAELMYFANAQTKGQWADQPDGVFGAAYDAVRRIITEECGQAVLDKINHSRHGFNFGGSGSFLEDIEQAVVNAYYEIKEDEAEEAERLEEERQFSGMFDASKEADRLHGMNE